MRNPRTKADSGELLPIDCLPSELISHYRELLRTYVIMGSGNLTGELKRLAELLVIAGLERSADAATAPARSRRN